MYGIRSHGNDGSMEGSELVPGWFLFPDLVDPRDSKSETTDDGGQSGVVESSSSDDS